MKRMLYIIGEPGVGKTTVVLSALPLPSAELEAPIPHLVYPGGVQLGRWRGQFSGTDGMTNNIKPRVLDWLGQPDGPSVVVAEGDRLANTKFFQDVVDLGWRLDVVALVASPEELNVRRDNRNTKNRLLNPLPVEQNLTWLKGRVTKNINLIGNWPGVKLLPTTNLLAAANQIAAHPVVRSLSGNYVGVPWEDYDND